MYASQMSKDLFNWIQEKERNGEIHSIFKSTINIISEDGKFIPIVINNKPISPFSIRLEKVINFREMDIKIGEKIIFTKINLKGRNININYDHAGIWNNSIDLVYNGDSLENIKIKLNIIKEYIIERGNKDGIYQLMQVIPFDLYIENDHILDSTQLFIKDRFENFIKAFTNNEVEEINNLSKKIIGFGPGLTPSMDDFLSGMMLINLYLSHCLKLNIDEAYEINHNIINNIDNKTTRVSEEMLKQTSIGEANEDLRNLMVSIISSDSRGLEEQLEKVISYGHSSGTDILCGIYIASYILITRYETN